MPYGATGDEIINALKNLDFTPTDEQKEFAEKYGIKVNTLLFTLQHHMFISARYVCCSIKDNLTLIMLSKSLFKPILGVLSKDGKRKRAVRKLLYLVGMTRLEFSERGFHKVSESVKARINTAIFCCLCCIGFH